MTGIFQAFGGNSGLVPNWNINGIWIHQFRARIPEKMSDPAVWYNLVGTDGNPFKGTSVGILNLPPGSVVYEFLDAVHLKNSDILTGIELCQLRVFRNKTAFESRNNVKEQDGSLSRIQTLDHLEKTEEEPLIVIVPFSFESSQKEPDLKKVSLTAKEPRRKRKKRWIQINEILDRHSKRFQTDNPIAFVTWFQLGYAFNTTRYVQEQKNMGDIQLDFLLQYLVYTTKCLGDITTGHSIKRLYFIAPILVCVCSLFNGDVKIEEETDLVGKSVKAHIHVEFMLRRGNKAVCVIQAKKGKMEEAMVQYAIGCEIAAEMGDLDIVHGIATDYIQWNFLRSLNGTIEVEECSMGISRDGPHRGSVKKVAEKIYAVLSDD